MAKGVVVCYWGPGHKTSGHLALAVEATAGKSYITWVPDGESGDPGSSQSLHDDFRVQTGIRTNARNREIAEGLGPLRTGQVRTARLSNALTKTPTQVQVGSQTYTFNYGQVFKQPDVICEIPAIDATGAHNWASTLIASTTGGWDSTSLPKASTHKPQPEFEEPGPCPEAGLGHP